MFLLLFGIIFFVGLIVYVAYLIIQKEAPVERRPTIHASGIYSVVRRSPRPAVEAAKPSAGELEEYLRSATKDVSGMPLTENDRKKLLGQWQETLESNLGVIETGDRNGLEIYFYSCPVDCRQSRAFRNRSRFVTREEIYQHPELVPPFHLGCPCRLVPDTEWKRGGGPDAKASPLLDGGDFRLPDWKTIEREAQ